MKTRERLYHGPRADIARDVANAYNDHAPEGLEAEVHKEADDRYLLVLVCDYRILCDWCGDRPTFAGHDLCTKCWDEREQQKGEARPHV